MYMKALRGLLITTALISFGGVASAHPRHHHQGHHHYYRHHHHHYRATNDYVPQHFARGHDARPRAWCGWYMRHLLGVADPSYNLARNWAHWGHAGAAGVGAVVVWAHHVGKIVGRAGGEWVIQSGNDGHAVRTRPRSIAGAIAIRWG